MRDRRTVLGLAVAIVTALLVWWAQGDAGFDQAGSGSDGPTSAASSPHNSDSMDDTDAQDSNDPASSGSTDPDSGLPLVDVSDLPAEARETLSLIDSGGPFPYDKDGSTFRNFEGILPDQPEGYYREYTVDTPGSDDRGARRIVAGKNNEFYYTEDHYASFARITR